MQKLRDSASSNELDIIRTIPVRKTPLFPYSRARKNLRKRRKFYENRSYEKADRKKRTHRLCTIAGTIESIAPEIKELTLPEVTNLLESIMDLPDVQRAIHNAVLLHLEKLTPAVLNDLVKAVYVHAPDNSSGHRVQDVEISYNYIGILPATLLYDLQNGKTA